MNRLGEPSGEVTADEAQHAQSQLPARVPKRSFADAEQTDKRPTQNHKKAKLAARSTQGKKHISQGTNKQPSQPNNQQPNKSARKSQTKHSPKAQAKNANNPFVGMDDSQRFASKLEMLISKNK